MADRLERHVLHHHEILQFFDFQDGGGPPSWKFKIEIFNNVHFRVQKYDLRQCVQFCGNSSYAVAEISQFFGLF